MNVRPDPYSLGDGAITLRYGDDRSASLLEFIHAAARHLRRTRIPDVEDVVPAYLAVTIFYDPLAASFEEMKARLLSSLHEMESTTHSGEPVREHVIPVRYEGVDLDYVATQTKLPREEVIAIHSGRIYTVDLLGFVPGFAYMSEVDPRIQLPRRNEPRPRVAAGSVAIAAGNTGVYPLRTPGGWHILGTTDVAMFDATRPEPALLAPGDRVRFERTG